MEYVIGRRLYDATFIDGENRGSMITGKSTHNKRIDTTLERCFFKGVLSYFYEYVLVQWKENEILDSLGMDYHLVALSLRLSISTTN